MIIERELFSPNAFWVWRYTLDPSVRNIVLMGGSSSSKSYSVAQFLSILTYWECSNHLVMRKVGASIEKTIYTDFKTAINGIEGLAEHCRFKQNSIMFDNGAKIDFTGLDDSEKIKGMLAASGFDFVESPEDADFILFNTCAVREHAEDRVFGNVGALKNLKRKHPCAG